MRYLTLEWDDVQGMIIVKCKQKDHECNLVGYNAKGKPVVLPNKPHFTTEIEITEELRKQLVQERFTEPFSTFMDVVKEEVSA